MKRIVQHVYFILPRNKVTGICQSKKMSALCLFSRKACVAPTTSGQRRCYSVNPSLCLKHALLVSKMTRYELECQQFSDVEKPLREKMMRRQNSDYDVLLQHHRLNKEFENSVIKVLKEFGIETRTVNRANCTQEYIDWADVVIPTGGDGTFLMAASRVWGNEKPVIGFNSDPSRSEGYLCLPVKYSANIKEALKKLKKGEFEWQFRTRIRITLLGENIEAKALDLTKTKIYLTQSEIEGVEHDIPEAVQSGKNTKHTCPIILPVLALNEVFMGESLSSRVSYFRLSVDDGVWTKVKSSGICVSTGSGSTSWHLSINRMTEQSVSEMMKLLGASDRNPSHIKQIADEFNRNLVFNYDDNRMSYTVRDLISAGVWPEPKGLKPRGFAKKIEVISRCFDGGLVVDGGVFFSFNSGMKAILEVHESDALRSVQLIEK